LAPGVKSKKCGTQTIGQSSRICLNEWQVKQNKKQKFIENLAQAIIKYELNNATFITAKKLHTNIDSSYSAW
jgi:hypothetical protein